MQEAPTGDKTRSCFTDYRDIFCVSQEYIRAIEAMRVATVRLAYGTMYCDEAFEKRDESLDGFSVELCRMPGGMFGIPNHFSRWRPGRGLRAKPRPRMPLFYMVHIFF